MLVSLNYKALSFFYKALSYPLTKPGLPVFCGSFQRSDDHGQQDQYEQDGAGQQQRAHQSQVAHGLGIEQDQAEEGAHGGHVADKQGLHHVLEHLALVAAVLQVVDEVQRIVDGDADNHRADADDDEAEAVAQQCQAAQRKEPAEEDAEADPEDVARLAEGQGQYEQNQQRGQRQGQYAVVLDLPGIGHGDEGRADGTDLHFAVGMLAVVAVDGFVEQVGQLCIPAGLADAIGGVEEDVAAGGVGRKQVAVDEAEVAVGVHAGQPLRALCAEVQGVVAYVFDHHAAGGQHQHLAVALHLFAQECRLRQGAVYAGIVRCLQQAGIVLPHTLQHAGHGLLVKAHLQVFHAAGGVGGREDGAEVRHGLLERGHRCGPLGRCGAEGDHHFLLAAQFGIDGGVLRALSVAGQEGRDVLAVILLPGQRHKQQCQHGRNRPCCPLSPGKDIVDAQEKSGHEWVVGVGSWWVVYSPSVGVAGAVMAFCPAAAANCGGAVCARASWGSRRRRPGSTAGC